MSQVENATERQRFCDAQNVLRLEGARANSSKLRHLDGSLTQTPILVRSPHYPSPHQLRHLDGSVASAELGAAERYLAAGHARNEVVVHVDDDAIPDEQNLKLLSRTFCSVHAEPGFPTCAPHHPAHALQSRMWSACAAQRATPATLSRTRPAVL